MSHSCSDRHTDFKLSVKFKHGVKVISFYYYLVFLRLHEFPAYYSLIRKLTNKLFLLQEICLFASQQVHVYHRSDQFVSLSQLICSKRKQYIV